MTDSEIFSEAMAAYGGEIKPEQYRSTEGNNPFEFVAKLAANWTTILRRFIPRLPEIYFGFVMNPTLNAAAFTHRGRNFVGMFAGTVFIFHAVFARMLSDRRILRDIGDALQEADAPQSLQGLQDDADKMMKSGLVPSWPNCPKRALYVERLFEDAVAFLILHELNHIAFGDAAYANRTQNLSCLLELAIAGASGNDIAMSEKLTAQAMEMNADAQACITLVDNARRQNAFENPAISIEASVFRRVFAVCTFFRMFGDTVFSEECLEDDHPHLRLRQSLTLRWQFKLVSEVWPNELREPVLAAMNAAVNEVESIFSVLTGEPMETAGLLEAQGIIGRNYQDMLVRHYTTVAIPSLQPYAHFDLSRLLPGFNRGALA